MYTLTLFQNPHSYPNYGSVTQVGTSFTITGVDIDDMQGEITTDKLTYAQRFSVNYLKLERDGVTLWAWITNVSRVSGANLVKLNFKIDAFRSFRASTTFGSQLVVRQPEATFDYDPLLRGNTGEPNTVTTTRIDIDNPDFRVLVVQIMRPDGDTNNYTNPVQPSPYIFYFKQYNINSQQTDTDIAALIKAITNSARPSNLAAIYSVPVFSSGGMTLTMGSLPLIIGGSQVNIGSNFFRMTGGSWALAVRRLSPTFTFTDKDILRTKHTVSIVIPEAGIIPVPDEVLFKANLRIRQDIDLYTGASNYMLVYDGADATPYSVRSGGLAGVPIAYDVQQQMFAANKSNIISGLAGDVASIGIGVAGIAGAGVTGGISGYMGAGMIAKGAMGILGTMGSLADTINQQVNPPSYLGSALAANFGQSFFIVTTRGRADNATVVRARYGYPVNQVKTLTIPSSGYIQTQDCNVGGNIPSWAREEINQLLNNGLRVL
jgi:hypothetical protein